ncbi:zinc-finger protein [Cypionkella aquatica]|uniref:Zinc-finger protein n=1 Tax=Cypionkella aquatica TaxID=1756042 RepID=A0AA37X0M9_9RHOB|nr:DUF983 domain-containing protein [Cypionkella aquatica]GLS86944.1 zinc-finger protein [Cypionkella aquatica]
MTDAALHLAPDNDAQATPVAERPIWPALRRGWARRCPCCGAGPLLKGYLKVRESCPVCSEDFTAQRADDGPAYLTILIVGHLMAPILMFVFVKYRPEPITLITMFSIFTVALSLYLLPRLKGALVALQWANRMHGFARPGPKEA